MEIIISNENIENGVDFLSIEPADKAINDEDSIV